MNIAVQTLYIVSDSPAIAFKDLDVVRLTSAAEDEHGRMLAAGSVGTVVAIYAEGSVFEVEFVEPIETLATVGVEALELVQAA